MADNTITRGAPGIAEFTQETWGNPAELQLQETPALAYAKVTITADGDDLDLALYSVVGPEGLAVYTTGTPDSWDTLGVLAMPVQIADGDSLDVYVIVQGNLDINALVWDASFNTTAKKMVAFTDLPSPMNIIVGENPYNSDGVLA